MRRRRSFRTCFQRIKELQHIYHGASYTFTTPIERVKEWWCSKIRIVELGNERGQFLGEHYFRRNLDASFRLMFAQKRSRMLT